MSDILDKSFDIFIICAGISLIIFVIFLSSSVTEDFEEKECVEFYKENNYITKSCEIYKDKLEGSDE